MEHKGLGGWMHSHIPTILNAILTGEPYQPHIWIERSGNKMAMLGNAASWVDAFPKLDLIVHMYMYPTSFSTELPISCCRPPNGWKPRSSRVVCTRCSCASR